ncbi:MAG: STAS domain-containing protein [Mucilaginibacter sp.]
MISVYKKTADILLLNLDLQEANLENADEFKAEITALFEEDHKNMALNMQQVEYIDSSFLGALVALLKHTIAFKKELILVGLRKDIADLFSLIRLDKVFKIYPGFDDIPAN